MPPRNDKNRVSVMKWRTIGVLYYHVLTTADGFVFYPSISMGHILGHDPTSTFLPPSTLSSSAGSSPRTTMTTLHHPLSLDKDENYFPHDQHPSAQALQQAKVLEAPRRIAPRPESDKQQQQRQYDDHHDHHHRGKREPSCLSFFRASRIIISRVVGSLVFGLGAYVTRGMMVEGCLEDTKPPPPYVSALVGVILLVGVGVMPCRKDGIRHWYLVDDHQQ